MILNRFEALRHGVSRSDRIIEIGPSYNPIFAKRDGWQTASLDHADRESLIAKYANDPSVDVANIEKVDFVWHVGDLADAVPVAQHGSFDVFVASHVIEHTTDLVAFLRSAERLLRPDGRVILAIPDKRSCFDCLRSLSTLGQVIEAHRNRASRHTAATLYDYTTYAALKNGKAGWIQGDPAPLAFPHPFSAVEGIPEQLASGAYVDAHNWVFVPSSFALIMLLLARLGLSDWQIERSETAPGTEFFVRLVHGGQARAAAMSEGALAAEKLRLMEAALSEQTEQNLRLRDAWTLLLKAMLCAASIQGQRARRLGGRLRRLIRRRATAASN